MSNKKFTICIDIDDTIHHLTKAWTQWLANQHFLDVKYEDITDWDMSLFYPHLTTEQICEPLNTPMFWDTVKPIPDAVEYINKLKNDGHDIYFCTSTDYRTAKFKFEKTIEKYFPFIDHHHIIITYNKQMIKCDFLIDDGYHNMYGEYVGLLFDTPANRKIDLSNDMRVFRVHSWEEIYDLISNISASS